MSSLQSLQTLGPREVVGVITPEALARFNLFDFLETKRVRPFTDESVDAYQMKKVCASARISRFFSPVATSDHGLQIMVGAALGGVVLGALIGGLTLGFYPALGFAVVGGLGFGLLTLLVFVVAHYFWYHHMGARWETVSLAGHLADGHKVPRRVLTLAKTLTAARPDLMVEVERFKDDPFLTIRSGVDVSFRVAFWNERGYRIPKV